MAVNINTLKAVEHETSREYMLRQLSEECAELTQASLKLIRAWNGETPNTEQQAMRHFVEELADVLVMTEWAYWCFLDVAGENRCDTIQQAKVDRMAQRMLGGGGR